MGKNEQDNEKTVEYIVEKNPSIKRDVYILGGLQK